MSNCLNYFDPTLHPPYCWWPKKHIQPAGYFARTGDYERVSTPKKINALPEEFSDRLQISALAVGYGTEEIRTTVQRWQHADPSPWLIALSYPYRDYPGGEATLYVEHGHAGKDVPTARIIIVHDPKLVGHARLWTTGPPQFVAGVLELLAAQGITPGPKWTMLINGKGRKYHEEELLCEAGLPWVPAWARGSPAVISLIRTKLARLGRDESVVDTGGEG